MGIRWPTVIGLLMCLPTLVFATVKPPAMAVASASKLATQTGINIMREGGNAFDAAVAVSAVLAVTEPFNSGLGGGGFWLLHRAQPDRNIFIDGRERAPLAASPTMYLNQAGHVRPGVSLNGPLAAAIPGEPAALIYIQRHYGKLSLAQDLAPAIHYALHGFKVTPLYREAVNLRLPILQKYPSTARIFLKDNNNPPVGTLIRQVELAQTLKNIAKYGRSGFYGGAMAKEIVKEVRAAGGIWDLRDLQFYQIVARQPITYDYHGVNIITAPPPSAGGIGLITMLNILKPYDLNKLSAAQKVHYIIEAMRLAYWQRSHYLGDPDFVDVPVKKLLSKNNADYLRKFIKPKKATPSIQLGQINKIAKESHHTTHFSIIDSEGNMVSATLTINYRFGSGFVVPGTGVLLNNEMDDFSAHPGSPNVYGLVSYGDNSIAPRKRPVSSMTPTFLMDNNGIAILGTPGGSRIVTMVLLACLDYFNHQRPKHWVSLKRYHMQYIPDTVFFEAGAFSKRLQSALVKMGYHLKQIQNYGNMQAILWDKKNNKVYAASDPRGEGQALVVKPATQS